MCALLIKRKKTIEDFNGPPKFSHDGTNLHKYYIDMLNKCYMDHGDHNSWSHRTTFFCFSYDLNMISVMELSTAFWAIMLIYLLLNNQYAFKWEWGYGTLQGVHCYALWFISLFLNFKTIDSTCLILFLYENVFETKFIFLRFCLSLF